MNQSSTLLSAAAPVNQPPLSGGTLKARFDLLHSRRFQKMRMAWDCAKLTIPLLLPEHPEDQQSYRALQANYTSMGARMVNNLASKLLLALFPTHTVFFKLTANEVIVQQLAQLEQMQKQSSAGVSPGQPGVKSLVEEKLAMIESVVMNLFERLALRAKIFEIIKLLIVTGDVLFVKQPGKPLRVFNLNSFVVTRDGAGELTELIIREVRGFSTLSEELQQMLIASRWSPPVNALDSPVTLVNSNVELFTVIERISDGRYRFRQELGGLRLPDERYTGEYTSDNLPYRVVRWNEVLGEDYGRSMVEDYIGDLRSLETDARTMDAITRACGRIIPLVDPTGVTKPQKLNGARDGEFVYGKREDVAFLTVDKINDVSVIHQHATEIKTDLKAAFLMNSVVQRRGERVTAEEIRTVATELEENLGGVYSVLSQDFQLPLVRLMYAEARQTFRDLGVSEELALDKELSIEITTGLDALGRGNDVGKLRQFIAALGELRDPQMLEWLSRPDFIKRLAAGLGIDARGLVKTVAEYQQEQQQKQQMLMGQQLIGEGAKAIPQLVTDRLGNGGGGQE